jgi:HAD superfamily hydrolase (TIGR01509 family)
VHAIQAVIFDMDGLLVDSEPLAARAMDDFLSGYKRERRAEIDAQLLGRRLTDALEIVKRAYELDESLDALVAKYGELRELALAGNTRLMPGAREAIDRCRDLRLRVGLATSAIRVHADRTLKETGLSGLFDAQATGDEVARGKPEPDLFLLAASRLGAAPASCVVFEDAPNGVAASIAAGMQVIAVPNASTEGLDFPIPPTRRADSLATGLEQLGELMAAASSPLDPTV